MPVCLDRSVGEAGRKWDFEVHKDLMFDEMAEPEQDTDCQ